MGKGKRRGTKGKHRGDGIPPPAPPAGAGDQGKQAEEVAVLRAVNARIIAELLETRARLDKPSPVAADGVQRNQREDGEVVLPGDVEEPPLHGATKKATVQETTDLEKDAVAEEADVSALPVLSEVSDAVSAVVDGEESEEESPEEEKLKSGESMTLLCEHSLEKQGKEDGLPADADVVAREVHVAATDSEEDAALRARLAAAEAKAARLEAANAEKLQALERLGAKEAEAKAASERVAELEKRLGEMNLSTMEPEPEGTISTELALPVAERRYPAKQKKKKAPAARGRCAVETEKPAVTAPAAALPARHGGKGKGPSQAGPELDAGPADGGRPKSGPADGGRPKRTVIPSTRYPSETFFFHGDAARVGFGQPSDGSS
ncbi:hypothetical protein ACQ4PT_001922 [Festuca glaucescens]